jgi:DNA-binding transcriptional ArsR family regulator
MDGAGATPRTLRELNAQTVLAALVRQGRASSRAELARITGMAKPTVGHALETLLRAGLVHEVSPPGQLHYGAVYFGPSDGVGHVLVVDIGMRYLRGATSCCPTPARRQCWNGCRRHVINSLSGSTWPRAWSGFPASWSPTRA